MEIDEAGEVLARVRCNIGEIIVGLEREIDMMLVSLLSGGHVLLEGPPGLGKTTLANTFSRTIGGEFRRVQMTPDMLPADVIGVNVYNQRSGEWELRRGPIFGNVVLVDEINRASPKVQSAFLEVMQEHQATIEGRTLSMPRPFMVIATQVPYGEPGTYPLTSVQIDRFAYKIEVESPSQGNEEEMLNRIDVIEEVEVNAILEPREVEDLKLKTRGIGVHERVRNYIVDVVSWLRERSEVRAGPSPRASIWFLKGCRAYALMQGRGYVIPDDVKTLAPSVLNHRLELTALTQAGDTSKDELIEQCLQEVKVPKGV